MVQDLVIEAQTYNEKRGAFQSRATGFSWAVDTDVPFQIVEGFFWRQDTVAIRVSRTRVV